MNSFIYIVFGVVGKVVRNLKENNICNKVFLLPFSVDTNIYKDLNIKDKPNDVLAAFTVRDDVYPNRKKVHKLLSRMGLQNIITKRVSQYALVQAINKSKISITSNNIFSSLSMRYTEVLSSGGFLLADKPEDFSELGYVDGKHLVLYKDLNDLKEKIYYYLKHEKERRHISRQGMEFVRTNHSCEIRARQFKEVIEKELYI
jgi:spore maturation protein CgeB